MFNPKRKLILLHQNSISKQITIKNYKQDTFTGVDDYVLTLTKAINQIFNNQYSNTSLQILYSTAEKLLIADITNPASSACLQLYQNLQHEITKKVQQLITRFQAGGEGRLRSNLAEDEEWLRKLEIEWTDFLKRLVNYDYLIHYLSLIPLKVTRSINVTSNRSDLCARES
jgi:hypothetical protein